MPARRGQRPCPHRHGAAAAAGDVAAAQNEADERPSQVLFTPCQDRGRHRFWLADARPAGVLAAVRDGTLLISDGAAPEESCGESFLGAAGTPVALYRCGAGADAAMSAPPAAASRLATIWRSDSGRPVLVEQPLASGRWLRFASRFQPAWSDLVLRRRYGLLRDAAHAAAGEPPASGRRPMARRRPAGPRDPLGVRQRTRRRPRRGPEPPRG